MNIVGEAFLDPLRTDEEARGHVDTLAGRLITDSSPARYPVEVVTAAIDGIEVRNVTILPNDDEED